MFVVRYSDLFVGNTVIDLFIHIKTLRRTIALNHKN